MHKSKIRTLGICKLKKTPYTQLGWLLKKTPENSKCLIYTDKLKHSCITGRNVKWCIHYEKQFRGSLKN